jgi:hypothetical protein
MNKPLIHGIHRAVSASQILQQLGDALSRIRQEDRLTWADIGAHLGKSEDQAAKYADGTAEMGAVACFRAWNLWGERFCGGAKSLFVKSHNDHDARMAQSCVLRAALALAEALEDGDLTLQEIRDNRGTLEKAQTVIAAQLARIGPKGEAA